MHVAAISLRNYLLSGDCHLRCPHCCYKLVGGITLFASHYYGIFGNKKKKNGTYHNGICANNQHRANN